MYIVRCVAAQRRNGNAQLQGAYEFKARDRTPGTRAWSAGRRSAHGDRRLQPVLVWRARRGGERIARWLLTILVVVLAFAIWRRFGSATLINRPTIVPSFRLTDLIFWGTIAFAWTGPEAASFMGGEIRNPQRCAAPGHRVADSGSGNCHDPGDCRKCRRMALALVPPADEVNPALAAFKVAGHDHRAVTGRCDNLFRRPRPRATPRSSLIKWRTNPCRFLPEG